MTAAARARTVEFLEKPKSVRGEMLPIGEHVARLVAAGSRVTTGPDGKRRLADPSGRFFAVSNLGKTAIDFADWLASRSAPDHPAHLGHIGEVAAVALAQADEAAGEEGKGAEVEHDCAMRERAGG